MASALIGEIESPLFLLPATLLFVIFSCLNLVSIADGSIHLQEFQLELRLHFGWVGGQKNV